MLDGKILLGILDTSLILTYAIGLFFSGFIADNVNLTYFLSFGMLGIALCTFMMGFAKDIHVHWFGYFLVVSVLNGLFQSTGWPSVVTVMSNWFPKEMKNRGLLMG